MRGLLMTWDELACEVKKAKLIEMRGQKDKYLEVVVAVADLKPMTDLFDSYFGSPLKPEGERASAEAARYADPFGGVQMRQILYVREIEKAVHGALLWPWADGVSVTVKIFCVTALLKVDT
jgi:hypothetical protein